MKRINLFTFMALMCVFFVGCKDETSQQPILPNNSDALPTEDVLSENVKIPTCVVGSDFDKTGSALCKRIEQRQTTIDLSTRVVIFAQGAEQSLTPEQFVALKQVYDNGGAIVLCEPTFAAVKILADSLGESIDHVADTDDGNGHFVDMFIFNNHGDEYELADIHDSDNLPSIMLDSAGVETNGMIQPSPTALTDYEYGLGADLIAQWLNEYAAVDAQKARALINIKAADLHTLTHAQTKTLTYMATTTNDKGKDKSAPYQITYTIYAVYSFEKNSDYYMVHEEIIGNNAPMKLDNWKDGKKTCYGFYLKNVRSNHNLLYNNGKMSMAQAALHDPTPTTSEGSSSVTSGYSVNWGGDIGLSPSGPSAGISAGGSISESYTTSIPDVTITNQSLTDNGNASWDYSVAAAQVTSNGWSATLHDSPAISRNTIILHNCWYWTVTDAKNYTAPIQLQCTNTIMFAYTWLHDKSFSYEWATPSNGYRYSCSFNLNAPQRTK